MMREAYIQINMVNDVNHGSATFTGPDQVPAGQHLGPGEVRSRRSNGASSRRSQRSLANLQTQKKQPS